MEDDKPQGVHGRYADVWARRLEQRRHDLNGPVCDASVVLVAPLNIRRRMMRSRCSSSLLHAVVCITHAFAEHICKDRVEPLVRINELRPETQRRIRR